VFKTHRLENIIRAGLKTFAATNARLEKLFLGQTAGRPHRRTRAEAGSHADHSHSRTGQHSSEKAAARREAFGGDGEWFEIKTVPAVDKLDGMSGANPAAGLTQSAIRSARVVVGLDGVERADLDALVAGNTGGLDLSFGGAEEVAKGEERTTRANVLAPEPSAENAEKEDVRKSRIETIWPKLKPCSDTSLS
jgi:hypothetical protein